MAEFMKNGIMVNINSKIDYETAAIVSEAFEIKLERDNSSGVSVEEIVL
ncbi:MAG: translation initiation factor IF-2 N-terminal domain-containing protein [Patescibacteria group bacterium]|nr:translation initiation factor IF-2 N-terminal domain-containing protein [Patescibacteria group bacterium]